MRLGRLHICYHFHHSRRQHLPLTGTWVVQRIAPQLRGQKWVKSSSRIVRWAAKFVSPIGLHHAVDGGTNCARLPSNASSMRFSGTRRGPSGVSVVRTSCPPLPDRCSETCENFDLLLGLEAEEEGVIPAPDLVEETLEPSPAAIPLGGSRWLMLSPGQQLQQRANIRNYNLRERNKSKILWNVVR